MEYTVTDMDINTLEYLSLEYLSSQIEPVEYNTMYYKIMEENGISSKEINVNLWIRLYSNRNVLILINEEFEEYLKSNFQKTKKRSKTNLLNIDINGFELNELAEHVPETRLLCSNTYRIKSLNLVLYEQVVKTNDRFKLVMLIASKRYSGYWQSDLINESKISPRDLFSLLNSLCKIGLVYKLTIPQNRISKILVNNISENCVIKYDNNTETQDSPLDVAPKTQNSASICFFHKYFILDKIPKFIRTMCMGEATKNYESTMLEILEKEENNILLESDWKTSYYNLAFHELGQINTRIDNHIISRSYLYFRKSLELKNKIALIFAWCPQTKKFERCIMLIKNPNDIKMKMKSSNILHVLNLKSDTQMNENSEEDLTESTPFNLNGHSIQEYVYYIIKLSRNGITAKDINNYVPIKYKQLSKLILYMESVGLIRKETERDGKIFMYRYYTTDSKTPLVKTEVIERLDTSYMNDIEPDFDSTFTRTSDKTSFNNVEYAQKNYTQFLNSQKDKYSEESVYQQDFERIFGNLQLPKQVNTTLFKKRMVLMKNYLDYFKAATFSNISSFYGDVERSQTKADRKTAVRIANFVLEELKYLKILRCEELKGANLPLTILFDSRHFNDKEAYNYIRNNINMKRNIISVHTSALKSRVNDHFKSPEVANNFQEDSIDILDSTPENKEMINFNIQVPCLVRNISVNQQKIEVNLENSMGFSQKVLSSNGYIFPIMTRIKLLHSFLVENFSESRFTTLEVLSKMTLEKYFQLIGCGYTLEKVTKYINENVLNLPDEYIKVLLNSRRDPIIILNNQLNFLYRIKLLLFMSEPVESSKNDEVETSSGEHLNGKVLKNSEVEKKEFIWELIKEVELYDYVNNQVVGKYEITTEFELYWQNLKVQVDSYINSDLEIPPKILKVKEVFVKKNWKKVIYLTSTIKYELDQIITIWLSLSCNSLHYKSLIKLFHMPIEIINKLSSKFKINNTQIYSYLVSKIKSNKYDPEVEDDRILNKILTNIHKDNEILWIARYVISEKLINQIFLNFLKNDYNSVIKDQDCENEISTNTNDIIDKFQSFLTKNTLDKSEECSQNRKPLDVWNYLHILFKHKYTVNECKIIFDYIINKSNFNLRILKKLRNMNINEIVHYTMKKSHTNVSNIYNTTPTNAIFKTTSYLVDPKKVSNDFDIMINTLRLKCILFTSLSSKGSQLVNNIDPKDFKQVLKRWSDHRWIVKSKQKTNLFKVYKLSNLSKLKLFPKYSTIYHLGTQLLSYIYLFGYNTTYSNPINQRLGMMPYYPNEYRETTLTMKIDLGLELELDPRPDNNSSFLSNNISVIKNCLDLDFYTIFNILENFKIVKFEPKWNNQSNTQVSVKSGYSRFIEGGISKHIKSMKNKMSISQVEANINSVQANLRSHNYINEYSRQNVIPKAMVCENELTDILNPLQFESSYPETFDSPKNTRKTFKNVLEVIDYLMNLFMLKEVPADLESSFSKIVQIVKSSGTHGISHKKLKFGFEYMNEKKTSNKRKCREDLLSNNDFSPDSLVRILVYAAAMLRLLIMVPNGTEYLYIYWEYCKDLFINKQEKNELNKIEEEGLVRKKPDYVPELMWIIWERDAFDILEGEMEQFLGNIKELFPEDTESYSNTLKSTSQNTFVKLDGHIDVHLVGFLSLKIFCMVKDKPGITVHQIWKDLVILDECEVEVLVESMVLEKILSVKKINVQNLSNSTFESVKGSEGGVVHNLYYPQETSFVVWKFKKLLLSE
ncbi:uncharacterized protein TA10410 [Theileria annulata]|uniref:B-block binding subunit of TFIIIC domain-containing protein n=1 Tax=Theileria annulata TaxID=5874 RepID=Q4U8Y5_THEAN|nr:uncharacterized protein TA10410 [Theileria annulata]CAI76718.1 hypothetical protein TA10410 [Theileria annulata]|eukprot:XP_953343.1 hypothetical protein TA10410 [Theileria annulata]